MSNLEMLIIIIMSGYFVFHYLKYISKFLSIEANRTPVSKEFAMTFILKLSMLVMCCTIAYMMLSNNIYIWQLLIIPFHLILIYGVNKFDKNQTIISKKKNNNDS